MLLHSYGKPMLNLQTWHRNMTSIFSFAIIIKHMHYVCRFQKVRQKFWEIYREESRQCLLFRSGTQLNVCTKSAVCIHQTPSWNQLNRNSSASLLIVYLPYQWELDLGTDKSGSVHCESKENQTSFLLLTKGLWNMTQKISIFTFEDWGLAKVL